MKYQTHLLQNGLRLVYQQEKSAVAYCGLFINAGSRDELDHELGMAHFVEHMVFKGTEKRRSAHIINRLENVGGELNAFTSKEETVIYAGILKEHIERAIELIADISLNSNFLQKEIDKEVEIVLDEIESYNDSPSELIYDDFDEMIFQNHSLAHHVLGKVELLKKYRSEDLLNFVNRLYRLDKMVFFVTGDIDFKKLIRWVEKYFQQEEKNNHLANRIAPESYEAKQKKIVRNTHQVHVLIGNRAYDLYHPNRMGMFMINNILGGPGMNSLLNLSLREKNALVYHTESNYQAFSDTGEWSVYFGCDPETVSKCKRLVFKELENLREKKISDSILKKYKLQLMGQMAIASEHRENMAIGLGKTFFRYNKIDSIEDVRKKIEGITAHQLQEIANEIFVPEQLSILKYT